MNITVYEMRKSVSMADGCRTSGAQNVDRVYALLKNMISEAIF